MLPPNTVQLEKTIKPLPNNVTILTEASEKKKQLDLLSQQEKSNMLGTQLIAAVSNGQLQSMDF